MSHYDATLHHVEQTLRFLMSWQLVRNIIAYGSTRRVAGGAVARFMSKKDLKSLSTLLPKNECVQLDRHKGVYVVMASDCIVTVGHRTKRFYN